MSILNSTYGTIDREQYGDLGGFSFKKLKKFANPVSSLKRQLALQNPVMAAQLAHRRKAKHGAHLLQGIIDDEGSGLGKFKARKLVKGVAIAAAAYYTGGAALKYAKVAKAAKAAKMAKAAKAGGSDSSVYGGKAKKSKKSKRTRILSVPAEQSQDSQGNTSYQAADNAGRRDMNDNYAASSMDNYRGDSSSSRGNDASFYDRSDSGGGTNYLMIGGIAAVALGAVFLLSKRG